MTETAASPGEESLRRLSEAVALLLWEYEAIAVRPYRPFRLASGNYSPVYVDCRRAISEPVFMQLFAAAGRLLAVRRGIAAEVVAGGATAGIPFATVLASALALPLVYVRKEAKDHGLGARVEGHLEAGGLVLLVEDLITDGGSKLAFLEAIAEAGGRVEDVLVLFDRQQGGAALLTRRGVRLHAVTNLETALATGEAAGLLSERARRTVDVYFRDPAAWHREQGLRYRDE